MHIKKTQLNWLTIRFGVLRLAELNDRCVDTESTNTHTATQPHTEIDVIITFFSSSSK